jgi:tetratricopeptide (TPR) repeat protein
MKSIAAAAVLLLLLAGSAWSAESSEPGPMGAQYMKAGQYDKAADKFTELLGEHNPFHSILAYLYRGCCYYQMGKFQEARNDADSALAVKTVGSGPASGADLKSLGYFLKASAFLAQGDYDGANDAMWGIDGDPGLAPILLRYLIPWVDEVLMEAEGGKPVQLVPLYHTLGKKIYDSLTSMLSNEDDAWDIR